MNSLSYATPGTTSSMISIKTFDVNTSIHTQNHFTIIIVEKGTGTAYLNHHALIASSPCVFCLNETDTFWFSNSCNCSGRIIYFHPSAITPKFSFDNVRKLEHSFSVEDIKHAINLSVFFKRNTRFVGYIATSEPMLKSLNRLIDYLANTIDSSDSSDTLSNITAYLQQLLKTHRVIGSNHYRNFF